MGWRAFSCTGPVRRRPAGASRTPHETRASIAERITVLTLIDLLEGAGAERTAVELALNLDQDRFRPIVCASRAPESDAVHRLRAAGVEVMRLDRRSWRSVGAWRPLLSRLRGGGVDILHAHKFGSNLWGVALGRLARTPAIIATEHSWSYEGRPERKVIDHLVGRTASVFVAVSEHDRRQMIALERIPARKIRVIPTGLVPHAGGEEAGGDAREELGIGPGAPVIGTVATVRLLKRLDLLIDAFAAVRATAPDARLLIVGDGPDLEVVRGQVAASPARDGIALLGRRHDVPRLLAAMDVFVMSSDHEGSPLSLIEAMAAGVPTVSTDVGGIPDLLGRDGTCGLLVPRGDARALGQALTALLADPDRRRRMGEAAAERAATTYGFDRVVERWQELYTELAARRGARARVTA